MGARAAIAIGLVLYVVLTTMVSFFWMTRVRRPADYLVAGRGLPFWVLAGTIIGTCIGTGVIIGGSGLAYGHGWAGCAYPIGLGLGTLFIGLFFAKMRRYKFMTLSEEIACYYERKRVIVEFSNITLFLSQLCWLTVQIMGGAAVVGAVTGLRYEFCVVLAGFAKAVITIPGGLKAVVYTDVLQTLILFCGFGFLIHTALKDSGGLAGLRQAVPADYSSFLGVKSFGFWNVASLILVLIINPIADPGRRLTMYSAHTERGAKWSTTLSGVVVILFSVAIGITGMYAYRLNPHLKVADQALPWLAMNVLPPWLAAFVIVGRGGEHRMRVRGVWDVLRGQRLRCRRRHLLRAAHLSAGDRALPGAPGGGGAVGAGLRVYLFHGIGALYGEHRQIRAHVPAPDNERPGGDHCVGPFLEALDLAGRPGCPHYDAGGFVGLDGRPGGQAEPGGRHHTRHAGRPARTHYRQQHYPTAAAQLRGSR